MNTAAQTSLFDMNRQVDQTQAVSARARMRLMIDRLTSAVEPPWRDEAAVILDDGSFRRAMRLVPTEEAQALWAEFDVQMERLYSIWAATHAS